jgi:threonine synthase
LGAWSLSLFYLSTRDARRPPERLAFDAALLAGLAADGGLYVPEACPTFDVAQLRALRGRSYGEVAAAVMTPFLGGAIDAAQLRVLVDATYRNFHHPAVAPLRQLDSNLWLLELFHGPTLAFKDYALQLVGLLFDHVLTRRRQRVTIIGATSGDTGSAAMEACRDREALDVFILYPEGRISEVQRRQMTTIPAANVHAIAIEGTFDDCQDLVKAMFADMRFRAQHNLSAVNSINWARIMTQVVYYVTSALALGAPDRAVAFSVPTGNFGNVYAAHVARCMGLPISDLVIGTNRNDILARFLNDGTMTMAGVEPSLSPSMDIQVSSNFERLYFELKGRDGAAVAAAFKTFRATGTLPASDGEWRRARDLFKAHRVDDEQTLAEIANTYLSTGALLDPHSAIAVATARHAGGDPAVPMVALACAHPAKFPAAVERATGVHPPLPPELSDLYDRPERRTVLPKDLAAVERFIVERARPVAAPAGAQGGV